MNGTKKILALLVALVALQSCYYETAFAQGDDEQVSKLLYALPVAKNIGFAYAVAWTTMAAHEFGHAIPLYYFHNQPIEVVMGSYDDVRVKKPLVDMKYLKIAGLHPFKGYNTCANYDVSKWKNIAMLTAGPAAGMLATFLVLDASLRNQSKHDDVSYATKVTTCAVVMLAQSSNLAPSLFGSGTDGDHIWEQLMKNKSHPVWKQVVSRSAMAASAYGLGLAASLGAVQYAHAYRVKK